MPSPVGHTLAGLIVAAVAPGDGGPPRILSKRSAVIVLAALAPDADLLLRFVDGVNHHSQETHSVGAALLAGLVAAGCAYGLKLRRPLALAVAVALGWGSHILLDYLNVDTNPPIGILALWPFSDGWFKFPWPIFADVWRSLPPGSPGECAHRLPAWRVACLSGPPAQPVPAPQGL